MLQSSVAWEEDTLQLILCRMYRYEDLGEKEIRKQKHKLGLFHLHIPIQSMKLNISSFCFRTMHANATLKAMFKIKLLHSLQLRFK